ncbi:MAG TPA: hypothetical protein VK463_09370, partial [Desulfomonilaceae bacterium]|nr:hypothetical protein [Desulfomonilaceae bacterium]
MKRLILPLALACTLIATAPAHAFLDYLFGGSSSRDAIDNSAIGDLRAWWTGNPAYQFNPYYSPQQNNPLQNQQQGNQQMGYPGTPQMGTQAPPPNITYNPPQNQQPYYGQFDPNPQQQQYQLPSQQYQTMPQQAPQQYQAMPQQYQAAPQQYQLPQQAPQ